MSYLGEVRRNWRPLLAASIGTGSGLMLFSYTTTVFAPYLVRQFHWPRSQFALLGLTMFSTLLAMPFIGRLTDRLGVRRMALLGTLLIPPCFIAYSLMEGSFAVFLVISALVLAFGSLTSPIVYNRLVAENFTAARGLALTIVTCTPALLGALAAPLLTHVNDAYGWRVGYRALAAWVIVGNVVAVLLIPPRAGSRAPLRHLEPGSPQPRGSFGEVLSNPAFWVLFAAFMLCTMPTPLHASQMSLMLTDRGLTPATAAALISVYAIGTTIGRIACGLALDKWPAHRVAALSMAVPAIGYALIAVLPGQTAPIGCAMFLIGLSQGAENDLSSFLVARHFDLRVFSTALSLVLCGVYFAAASGSLILSTVLRLTDSFTPFLGIVSASVFAGSLLFLLLGRRSVASGAPEAA